MARSLPWRLCAWRLCVCCVLLAAAAPGLVLAAPARPDALFPGVTLPGVASQSADEYYIDLLKWTRTVTMGKLTVRVSYLDPPLFLAWLKQSDPDVTQTAFQAKLAGFPRILRFRVAFQAPSRADIRAKAWRLTLTGPTGQAIAARDGHQIAPMDVESGAGGNYWEADWDYAFAVPEGFLNATRKFDLSLSGPAGDVQVVWLFGVQAAASESAGSYVTYLGAGLLAFCVLLLAALFATRPPRASAL